MLTTESKLLVLSHFEATLRPILGQEHEVLHLLVIDLDDGEADLERLRGTLEFGNAVEDFIASDGHDALVRTVTDLVSNSNKKVLPWNRTYPSPSGRRQTGNSDSPPMHCQALTSPMHCTP